jgi:molybdopterin biosynthesis enzyme MoaB
VTHGRAADESGDAAEAMVRAVGLDVVHRSVVPDERPAIEARLRELAAAGSGS